MNRILRNFAPVPAVLGALLLSALLAPVLSEAQQHGADIKKTCTKLRRCGGVSSGVRCTSDAQCPGVAPVCVGGPDAGAACMTVASCRAATACAACVPVAEVTAGADMDCEIFVTNIDSFPSASQDPLAVTSIVDMVDHAAGITTTANLIPGAAFGYCQGDATFQNLRCSSNADCGTGSCSIGSFCVGGMDQGKPCPPSTCPGGVCSVSPRCVSPSNTNGPACGGSLPACSPPSVCSIVLPRGDLFNDFVGVAHTEPVAVMDPSPLGDDALTMGIDTKNKLQFNLDFPSSVKVEAPPRPCRLTGGGWVLNETDLTTMAEIPKATFGGQVGAPCGCVGCAPPSPNEFVHIQGNWTHMRKNKSGGFKATDFNSLICGCEGVLMGDLCLPGRPPDAPANTICVTGRGEFNPTGSASKGTTVAFRLEAKDKGEPGLLKDSYRLRLWQPGTGQSVEDIARAACCTNPDPLCVPDGHGGCRAPVLDDSGFLQAGNLQIHPALDKSFEGPCPPPSLSCRP